jgi:hypothetical protein
MTKRQRTAGVLALVLTLCLFYAARHQYQLRNTCMPSPARPYSIIERDTVSYITRPLWDSEEMPSTILKHVSAEGLEISQTVCELHGWTLRKQKPQVFDGVLFSTELDLLELRWNEVRTLLAYAWRWLICRQLDPVVNKFFLVEVRLIISHTGIPS